jgi:ribonuclease P protein component
MISKKKPIKERGKSETNLSTQPPQKEENSWISGEDEYQKRPESFEAKESKGEEKVNRLGERRFRFTKKERINHPLEFRKVVRGGKKAQSRHFTLFLQDNRLGFHRLGVVVKKETGPATYRNRIKRYIREFFRLHRAQKKGSFDIILLARKGNVLRHYREAEEELKGLLLL